VLGSEVGSTEKGGAKNRQEQPVNFAHKKQGWGMVLKTF